MAQTPPQRKMILSDVAYAMLGAGDAVLERARRLTGRGDELPEEAMNRVNEAVRGLRDALEDAVGGIGEQAQRRADEAEEGFDSLADRGRRLVGRVSRQPAVTQAQQDVVQAQRGVKGAVTSAGTNTGQAMSKVKAAGTMSAKATDSVTEAAQTVAKEVAGTRHDKPLSEHTKAQLYELATERDIQGRSSMNKDELLAALKKDDR